MNLKNEDAYYRNMELIRERFGEAKLIPLADVAEFLGVDLRTLRDTRGFPVKETGAGKVRKKRVVPVTGLAAWMC